MNSVDSTSWAKWQNVSNLINDILMNGGVMTSALAFNTAACTAVVNSLPLSASEKTSALALLTSYSLLV